MVNSAEVVGALGLSTVAAVSALAASDAVTPYVNVALQGGAGIGLILLFWRILREQTKEYQRVKTERDEAISDHHHCEELVDRLVGALRKSGVDVPWQWKQTPPAPAAPMEGQ